VLRYPSSIYAINQEIVKNILISVGFLTHLGSSTRIWIDNFPTIPFLLAGSRSRRTCGKHRSPEGSLRLRRVHPFLRRCRSGPSFWDQKEFHKLHSVPWIVFPDPVSAYPMRWRADRGDVRGLSSCRLSWFRHPMQFSEHPESCSNPCAWTALILALPDPTIVYFLSTCLAGKRVRSPPDSSYISRSWWHFALRR